MFKPPMTGLSAYELRKNDLILKDTLPQTGMYLSHAVLLCSSLPAMRKVFLMFRVMDLHREPSGMNWELIGTKKS
jgi:hypothetical protein